MIDFSGYNWYVKNAEAMGPGPNNWNPNNVWVDSEGKLHLKISFNQTTQKWDCAEVWSNGLFGFGTYEWVVESRVDQFDKAVVLGLFNYLPTTDGANEIDIEISKWSDPTLTKICGYTVWPTRTNLKRWTNLVPITSAQASTPIKHTFNWQSKSVLFKSTDSLGNVIGNVTYKPTKNPTQFISQVPEAIHMNLWINQGITTMPNTTVTEVIIHSFKKS